MSLKRVICALLSFVLLITQNSAYAAPGECLQISAAAAKEARAKLQSYQEELDKKAAELKQLKASGKRVVKIGSKYTTGIAASTSALFTVLSVKVLGTAGGGVGTGIAAGFLSLGAAAVAAIAALVAVVAGVIWFFTRNDGNEVPIEELEKHLSDLKEKTVEARKALDQTNAMNAICNKYQNSPVQTPAGGTQ